MNTSLWKARPGKAEKMRQRPGSASVFLDFLRFCFLVYILHTASDSMVRTVYAYLRIASGRVGHCLLVLARIIEGREMMWISI
jgi:hypothetical protein